MKGFWAHVVVVEVPDGCWMYRGTRRPDGYGVVNGVEGKQRRAHHVSWYLTYGEWPNYLMHRCDNPRCVNPAHLTPGNQRQNMADMTNKGHRVRGERITWAKLTDAKVTELRRLRSEGWSYALLADRYGVSKAAVIMVVQGLTWRHVT